MQKVTIHKIEGVKDVMGKYGNQKMIRLTDTNGNMMSGFIDEKNYNPSEWRAGASFVAEVKKEGKYTNFKIDQKKAAAQASSAGRGEVMALLNKILTKLENIERQMNGSAPPAYPGSESDWPVDDFNSETNI